jgi:hypothetical protein
VRKPAFNVNSPIEAHRRTGHLSVRECDLEVNFSDYCIFR